MTDLEDWDKNMQNVVVQRNAVKSRNYIRENRRYCVSQKMPGVYQVVVQHAEDRAFLTSVEVTTETCDGALTELLRRGRNG